MGASYNGEDEDRLVKEHVTEIRRDVSAQLRRVLQDRAITTVFQPIFGFREGRILGYEALVRGPEGSLIQTPFELFSAAQEEGLDKNFAGLLPVWDLIFGTFYMPEGRVPTRFGVINEHVPEGFWKQLLWPFRRSR